MKPELTLRRCGMLLLGLLATISAAAREDLTLDSGWQFKLGEVFRAQNPEINAGRWPAVSILHRWGWQAAQAGKDYYPEPGWYRRELKIAPEDGKRCFLWFEAASLVAVRVSNEQFPDVAPLSGGSGINGGLYRPVHLIATAAVCFTPTDHASSGCGPVETAWKRAP